jgi:hypothetical protein
MEDWIGMIVGSTPMIIALCGWVYQIKENKRLNNK